MDTNATTPSTERTATPDGDMPTKNTPTTIAPSTVTTPKEGRHA